MIIMSIILIKPNNFNLSKSIKEIKKEEKIYKKNINYSKIFSIDKKNFYESIKDYVTIIDIKNNDFNQLLVESLDLPSNTKLCEELTKEYKSIITHCHGETINVYQDPEHLFQMCLTVFNFMSSKKDRKNLLSRLPPTNKLASLLTVDNRPIFGNVVLLCNKVEFGSKKNIIQKIELDDILLSLYSKAKYYGINMKVSGQSSTIIYDYSDKFLGEKKFLKKVSGFELTFYQLNKNSKEKNIMCSKIIGKDVYGNFNIIMTKNKMCCDLFKLVYDLILNLFNNYDQKIIDNELNIKIDNHDIYQYRRLYARLKKS